MSSPADSAAERRAQITAQIKADTGIDEVMINRLVRGFYARVREDALIGPIFNSRITEWEPHLQRMCDFWSSVALLTGRYHGQRCNAISRCRPIRAISTAGSRCSNTPHGNSVRQKLPSISLSGRAASAKAWNSASRGRTAYSSPNMSGSGAPNSSRRRISESSSAPHCFA